MEFDLEKHNQTIEQVSEHLKTILDTSYNAYTKQSENDINEIFVSSQKQLNSLSSDVQVKIIEFTKRFISISKSRPFFLKDIKVVDNTVDIIITTNIIDLTHEDHKNFLEMINISDNINIDIGNGDSVAITIIFTIKGE